MDTPAASLLPFTVNKGIFIAGLPVFLFSVIALCLIIAQHWVPVVKNPPFFENC
jgi:hypothetical protein